MAMAARVMFSVAILFLAHVRVQATITSSLTYQTVRTSSPGDMATSGHLSCEDATTGIDCDGGHERAFSTGYPPLATNVLPQADPAYNSDTLGQVWLKYTGDAKWLSIVDRTLNNNDPCSDGAYAAAPADSTHTFALFVESNGMVRVQNSDPTYASASKMLDASKEYVVCGTTDSSLDASNVNSNAALATWDTTDIYLKVSKIRYITIYGKNFKTEGTIPYHQSLTIGYNGEVLANRWISLVSTSGYASTASPCDDGAVAAAEADGEHSGSLPADGNNEVTANTAALTATNNLFAVCYTESGGITSSQWRDTGIRVKVSMVQKVWYGVDTTRFGDGFARATYNRNPDDDNNLATDTFPQVDAAQLRYEGELVGSKWLSLVDTSLRNYDSPCSYAKIAGASDVTLRFDAAGEDGSTTTSANERHTTGGGAQADSTKTVAIPQATNNLLHAGGSNTEKVYAVCYAESTGDGSDLTWADSYARFRLTKVEALGHHSVLHTTTGVLPLTDSAVPLKVGYSGSLVAGDSGGNIRFSLVLDTTNQMTVNDIDSYWPCALSKFAADGPHADDGSKANYITANQNAPSGATTGACDGSGTEVCETTGAIKATQDKRYFQMDTSALARGSIDAHGALDLSQATYAVCYTEDPSEDTSPTPDSWRDSGIRVTVGMITHITHGTAADAPYVEREMKPIEESLGGNAALGGDNDRVVDPDSSDQPGTVQCQDDLGNNLASNLPCGWEKSTDQQTAYIGLSPGLAAATNVIPQSANQDLTYFAGGAIHGSDVLGNNKYISLVAAHLNGYKPCAIGSVAAAEADSLHSGAILSSGTTATIPQTTTDTLLDHSHVYAVCYAITSGNTADLTWADTYIRTTISKVKSISSLGVTHSVSGYVGQIASRSANTRGGDAGVVDPVTGQQTFVANGLDLTYDGTLASGSQLALVDARSNNYFPCSSNFAMGGASGSGFDTAYATASASRRGTGAITAGQHDASTDKTAIFTTATLDAHLTYAACYEDGGAWFDSGIRFTRSPIYSMQHSSGYEATFPQEGYTREQTSVFRSTNRIPVTPDSFTILTYVDQNRESDELTSFTDIDGSTLDYSGTTFFALVEDASGVHNPCVRESIVEAGQDGTHTYDALAADKAGAGSSSEGGALATKQVKIYQAASGLNPTATFRVCYALSDPSDAGSTAWKDTYIKLGASQISELGINLGQWAADAGTGSSRTFSRCLAGQQDCTTDVTSIYPENSLTTFSGGTIGGLPQKHRTVGQLPQKESMDRGLDVYFQGTLAASAYVALVDESVEDTGVRTEHGIKYPEPCTATYTEAASSRQSGAQAGNGVGFCLQAASENLCDTSGSWSTSAADFTDTCVVGARCLPSRGCGTGGMCVGGQVSTLDTVVLDKSKTFALCYTATSSVTDAPAVGSASWMDSGIRLTISQIRNIISESGYTGITSRIQTSVYKPTNRIPMAEGMKLGYAGELLAATSGGDKAHISLVKVTGDSAANMNPCITPAQAGAVFSASVTSGPEPVASDNSFVTQTGGAVFDGAYTLAVCYSAGDAALTAQTSGASGSPAVNNGAAGAGVWWLDSGIRLGVSQVHKLRVVGVDVITTGQVPNVDATDSKLRFHYYGALPSGSYLSLVDATLNSEFPCDANTVDGQNNDGVSLNTGTHSGVKGDTAGTGAYVNELDTQKLDTDSTFAVCYTAKTSNPGWADDTLLRDSGIRVTVPKVWNVLADSLVAGGDTNCDVQTEKALKADCKLDTKFRDMTSKPLSTNRIANSAGQDLTYVGDLVTGGYLSLVSIDVNPGSLVFPGTSTELSSTFSVQSVGETSYGNPCVDPAEAGHAAGTSYSGPFKATGDRVVTLNAAGLDVDKTFAVCYTDGSEAAISGDITSDSGWADSYIRLKVTQIEQFLVNLQTISATAADTLDSHAVPIRTFGQIPNQATNEQVWYSILGSLPEGRRISLVHAGGADVLATEPITGSEIHYPCDYTTPYATGYDPAEPNPAAGGHFTTGSIQTGNAGTGKTEFDTTPLLTTYDPGSGTRENVVYALCYNPESTYADTEDDLNWKDSGIRITVPKIHSLRYYGTTGLSDGNDALKYGSFSQTYAQGILTGNVHEAGDSTDAYKSLQPYKRRREMTSIHLATNVIAQADSLEFVYVGGTNAWQGSETQVAKHIALVAASTSAPNPCVAPTLCTVAGDCTDSTNAVQGQVGTFPEVYGTQGVMPASATAGQSVTIVQGSSGNYLAHDQVFAVCYSDGVSISSYSESALGWRDTYIRLRVSKVTDITAYQVTHFTTGQIPNHPDLKLEYGGTLAAGRHIVLVDASTQTMAIGRDSYPFPCASTSGTAGSTPSTFNTNIGTATGSEVELNTGDLEVYDSSASAHIRYWTGNGEAGPGVDDVLAGATSSGNPGTITGLAISSQRATIDTLDGASRYRKSFTSERYYAVCYSDDGVLSGTSHFHDSGIRVTLPEVINFQVDSGYSNLQTVCVSVGDASTTCDSDFNGVFGDACQLGLPCDASATDPCGASGGRCAYQEICTSVDPRGADGYVGSVCDVDGDGTFTELCAVNALCDYDSNPSTNGGCGTSGVCARQGTMLRDQTSWAQSSASALVETPTNRLSAGTVAGLRLAGVGAPDVNLVEVLQLVKHRSAEDATNWFVSVVQSNAGNAYNPCAVAGKTSAFTFIEQVNKGTTTQTRVSTVTKCSDASTCAAEGSVTSSKLAAKIIQVDDVQDDKLAPETANTYAVCYAKVDGVINAASQGGGYVTMETWRDSYVRLKMSQIDSLITAGVTHVTTGQIPNVVPTDLMRFTYDGVLPAASKLSFVESSQNGGLPCAVGHADQTPAGDYSAWANRFTHSGVHTAGAGDMFVTDFDTSYMFTNVSFALCYDEDGFDTWADSGIRVTLPEIYSVQFAAVQGTVAGASLLNDAATKDGACRPTVTCNEKEDTVPRAQTSNPLATNRFPQEANQDLTYLGDAPDGMYLSLVAISNSGLAGTSGGGSNAYGHTTPKQGLNPCVFPFFAGAQTEVWQYTSDTDADSVNDAVPKGYASAAQQATARTVTIPQTENFNEDSTFAVCYSHSGTVSDHTWRDTYIRLKISQITKLTVNLPHLSTSATSTADAALTYTDNANLDIHTVGQIPVQLGNEQVYYGINTGNAGLLATDQIKIRLIEAGGNGLHTKVDESAYTAGDVPTDTTGYTGIANYQPCAAVASASDAQYTTPTSDGAVADNVALSGNQDLNVQNLDTTSLNQMNGGSSVVYALCYATNQGSGYGSWADSGIRLTVPRLNELTYYGNMNTANANLDSQYRKMTSLYSATNVLPRVSEAANWNLGALSVTSATDTFATGDIVALVDVTQNGGNPCVNPTTAGMLQSAYASGPQVSYDNSGTSEVSIPQSSLLGHGSVFTVCYAENDGSGSAVSGTWRDSYIRMTTSQIATITTHNIIHKTTGQIPSHPKLVLEASGASGWAGVTQAGTGRVFLRDASRGKSLLSHSTKTYAFPCAETAAGSTSAWESYSQTSSVPDPSNPSKVWIDTSHLDASTFGSNRYSTGLSTSGLQRTQTDTQQTGKDENNYGYKDYPRYYAVCYSEDGGVTGKDTGIRVTVPEVTGIQIPSGYEREATTWNDIAGVSDGSTAPRPWRHLTSEPSNINRLPHFHSTDAAADKTVDVHYVIAPSSGGCKKQDAGNINYVLDDAVNAGAGDVGCLAGAAKFLSLVEVNGAGNCWSGSCDPCSAAATATAGYVPAQAGAGSTKVSIDTSGLLANTEYAVCYSLGEKLAEPDANWPNWGDAPTAATYVDGSTNTVSHWRDTYVRVRMSKLATLTSLGVRHLTYGQLPDVMPADKVDFVYRGTLSAGSYISLVDASLNDDDAAHQFGDSDKTTNPCSATHAGQNAFDSQHSTPAQAGSHKCFQVNVAAVQSTCTAEDGTPNVACYLNAPCTPAATDPCGIAGACRAAVSGLRTSGLRTVTRNTVNSGTAPGESLMYVGASHAHAYNAAINTYDKGRYFAVCYRDPSDTDTWEDSGIRVTISPIRTVRTVQLASNYGSPDRDQTSAFSSTNRLPVLATDLQVYSDLLGSSGAAFAAYVSLVDISPAVSGENAGDTYNKNPCVGHNLASSGAGTHSSRVITLSQSDGTFNVDADADGMNIADTSGLYAQRTYTVCYNDGDNDANRDTHISHWKDSYIHFQLSEIRTFTTKAVTHLTAGQIPNHKAGLVYAYSFSSSGDMPIALRDASINAVQTEGYSTKIASPCHYNGNLWQTTVTGTSTTNEPDDVQSGITTGLVSASSGQLNGLDTTTLDKTATYALCYAAGTVAGAIDEVEEWRDSGIRLTVSQISAIKFSGYAATSAHAMGKKERTISSVLPSLQSQVYAAGQDLHPNVLPEMNDMPFEYWYKESDEASGLNDLGNSAWISLVQVSQRVDPVYTGLDWSSAGVTFNTDNVYNPCVDSMKAGSDLSASGMNSGPVRACHSTDTTHAGGCEHGDGHHSYSDANGNKEVTVPLALEPGNIYAVCYRAANTTAFGTGLLHPHEDGSATQSTLLQDAFVTTGRTIVGAATWRDSYIRVTISAVAGVSAMGINHYDRGHLASNEQAARLSLTISGSLLPGQWFSLVDEMLGDDSHLGSNTQDVQLNNVQHRNSPCRTPSGGTPRAATSGASEFGQNLPNQVPASTSIFFDAQHSGIVKAGASVLHEVAANDCGVDWTDPGMTLSPSSPGTAPTTGDPNFGDYFFGEALASWGCPKTAHMTQPDAQTYWAAEELYQIDGTLYIAESRPAEEVLFATTHLDTTKRYALCFTRDPSNSALSYQQAGASSMWWDSGMRFTVSKLETLRDNIGQLPLLYANNLYQRDISKFARSLSSSRARVGRPTCVKMGSSGTQLTCDTHGLGLYNQQCVLGAYCDPHWPGVANGGCGNTGQCSTGLLDKLNAGWSHSGVYNQHGVHKLRRISSGSLSLQYLGKSGSPMNTYDPPMLTNSPSTVTAVTFPTSAAGSRKYEFSLQYPASGNGVTLVASHLNSNDPCSLLNVNSYATTFLATAGTDHTVVYTDTNDDGVFSIPAADMASLDTAHTYTLCYQDDGLYGIEGEHSAPRDSVGAATAAFEASEWRDSYIRVTLSDVADISSHEITHRSQGHLARSSKVSLTYDGSSASKQFAMVPEEINDYSPCSDPSKWASVATAVGTTTSDGQYETEFDTTTVAATDGGNFALCYTGGAASASDPWSDSGIRTTISKIGNVHYNKQTSALSNTACTASDGPAYSGCYISQRSTRDYDRVWISTNVGDGTYTATDSVPIATNRLPVTEAPMDLQYDDTARLAAGQHIALVAIDASANSDKNPCASNCADDNSCLFSDLDGVGASAGASSPRRGLTSGVITASPAASSVIRVDQSTSGSGLLDATYTYAVCYSQTCDGDDGDCVGDINQYTFRDSYIRVRPSKVHTISAYGIDHYTWGDIPAKPTLHFTGTGAIAGNTVSYALVDETKQNHHPCDWSSTGSVVSLGDSSGTSTMKGVCSVLGTSPLSQCDLDNDGVFSELCEANAFCQSDADCGTGGVCKSDTHSLDTSSLDADKHFAVCYSEDGGSSWNDAGLRVQTPQVQSITYSAPGRMINAASCFNEANLQNLEDTADNALQYGGASASNGYDPSSDPNVVGVADCRLIEKSVGSTIAYKSTAHYSIGALLPRAADVEISYGSPSIGAGILEGGRIALVEHSLVNIVSGSMESQKYNPCRNHEETQTEPGDETGTAGAAGNDNEEGGMRLHSGVVQAVGATATIAQHYDGHQSATSVQNRLDYTKTYAVCYQDYANGANPSADWRDSYIRVRLSKIKTLSMVHTAYPNSMVNVSTIGTFSNVPSLEVEWDGSLMYNQYLRLVLDVNSEGSYSDASAPCDPANAADGTTNGPNWAFGTPAISSLSSSKRLTFDTSYLVGTGFYAVCYATGTGDTSDTTWMDSGIRLRFVRWSNPAKHRVVSGAPVRLSFEISTGMLRKDYDKVVFMKGETDCSGAPAVVQSGDLSDGSKVSRTVDFVCTAIGTTNVQSTCNSDFDNPDLDSTSWDEQCVVGALCDPTNANNGGCGDSGGICSGAVQLPTGMQYAEEQDATHHSEVPLQEGNYAMCMCLGSPQTGTYWPATSSSYGPANGNGGCDDANEFTLVYSSKAICTSYGGTGTANTCDTDFDGVYDNACAKNARCSPGSGTNGGCGSNGECDTGVTLKVISEPQLGRYLDIGGQLSVRHAAGMSQKYNIKTVSSTAGYEVAGGDKIFFVPSGMGCGYTTKYSGEGVHTFNHGTLEGTSSWSSTGVDRRWRAMVTTVCTTLGTSPQDACGSNLDSTCQLYSMCSNHDSTVTNGGCGTGGVCGSLIPASNAVDRTSPISLAEDTDGSILYDGDHDGDGVADKAASFTTPSDVPLNTAGMMTACFATEESLAGFPSDSTDYVELTHGMEIIATPALGVVGTATTNPDGRVFAIEDSSPSFRVTSMKAQDKYYFVPQSQSQTSPHSDDCTPTVCTLVGGSNVAGEDSNPALCDADHDGQYDDTCVLMARCDVTNDYNGGCGTSGVCEETVPTMHATTYTGLIEGTNFETSPDVGQLQLPSSTKLAVPAYQNMQTLEGEYPSAWSLVACLIPAGAIIQPSNVKQLDDILVVIKEPTFNLLDSWFQNQVYELEFTGPQQGVAGVDVSDTVNYDALTGQSGDIIVLQQNDCSNVETVVPYEYTSHVTQHVCKNRASLADVAATSESDSLQDCYTAMLADSRCYKQHFMFDSSSGLCSCALDDCVDMEASTDATIYRVTQYQFDLGNSARFTLESAGDTTIGEVGGGVARALSLARGKVNELSVGKYKICYATKRSVGESNDDFKMLSTKEIEILPTPATHPSVSAPRSIILGQDVVVSWASNVELSTNRTSHPDSWLGLFVKDSCVDTHDCYIAWQSISANDYTGTVIFSQSDYKNSGEYEVRYFKGSIHNGASQNSANHPEGVARETGTGVVCRGLSGVPSETYVTCTLEMSAQSETIYVMGSDIDETEDLSLRPGLEAVFGHGNRGRYHRTKLT